MSDAQRQRLFLGIPLDAATRSTLTDYAAGLAPLPGQTSPPENWHLTLVFVGHTAADRRDALVDTLHVTSLGAPFELEITGPGAFGRPGQARVLWLGVGRGEPELRALQAVAQEATAGCGFAPEARPYAPHLTLARLSPPRDAGAFLSAPPVNAVMQVGRVVLFESRPGRHGSEYTELTSIPLREP